MKTPRTIRSRLDPNEAVGLPATINLRRLLAALAATLVPVLVTRLPAQTFTTLYHFTGSSDGSLPYAGLVLSSNVLYGTATGGGDYGYGTVFKLQTDGTGFVPLWSFTSGSDGTLPAASLTLLGDTLYGGAARGGNLADFDPSIWYGSGALFSLNTDSSTFTVLYGFSSSYEDSSGLVTNTDGGGPFGALAASDTTLYGTTYGGGTNGRGTVFAVNTDGSGFTVLHDFADWPYQDPNNGADSDAALILAGGTLYGTTSAGGGSGNGTVFRIGTDGTGFTVLHRFTGVFCGCYPVTNSDGACPGNLILSGDTLYGTATGGGTSGEGTVFKVRTNGTGFTTLHSFAPLASPAGSTNSDGSMGASPGLVSSAGLVLLNDTVYGVALVGGPYGMGTVFSVHTNGMAFTVLHSFTPESASAPYTNSDGAIPYGTLVLSGNTLYGTAARGGNFGNGTIFSITLPRPPPQLTIVPGIGGVILTWPTNATGFTLQSTANLSPPALWSTNLPPPVVVNGQLTVTNPVSGAQQFYRLSQ